MSDVNIQHSDYNREGPTFIKVKPILKEAEGYKKGVTRVVQVFNRKLVDKIANIRGNI